MQWDVCSKWGDDKHESRQIDSTQNWMKCWWGEPLQIILAVMWWFILISLSVPRVLKSWCAMPRHGQSSKVGLILFVVVFSAHKVTKPDVPSGLFVGSPPVWPRAAVSLPFWIIAYLTKLCPLALSSFHYRHLWGALNQSTVMVCSTRINSLFKG